MMVANSAKLDFIVEYPAGGKMARVDALSRNPTLKKAKVQTLVVDIPTDD